MKIDEQKIKTFSTNFEMIQNEISKHIIGQKTLIENVLVCIIVGGNVLLEGLPGLGKTQLVKMIGKVMDMDFSRIQFTPDLMPADVTGTDIYVKTQEGGYFQFQSGPIFSNIVLADEINRATPKTQSALLEAMQEKTVTVGNHTYPLPEPFFVLATQNPLELEGTYPLPEAQLDRFLMKCHVLFPDKEALYQIVALTTGTEVIQPEIICNKETIFEMRTIAQNIPISQSVGEFAMNLILKGHPESSEAPDITKQYVRYGASPRGAQAIINVARIYALLDGRFHVAFDDVKKAALPTLRHRLFLNFEAVSQGVTADQVILELLQ